MNACKFDDLLKSRETITAGLVAGESRVQVLDISPSQSPSYTKATLHMLGMSCMHQDGLRFIFSVQTEAGDIVRLDLPFSALGEMVDCGIESLGYLIARHSDKSSGNPSRDVSPQDAVNV